MLLKYIFIIENLLFIINCYFDLLLNFIGCKLRESLVNCAIYMIEFYLLKDYIWFD